MNIVVKNRDLLRQYKELKSRLISGEVDEILVPQEDHVVLKISIQKEKSSFEMLTEKILASPFKNLRRPEEDII